MHFETTKAGKFSDMNHIPGKWEVFNGQPNFKICIEEGGEGRKTNKPKVYIK